MPPLSLLALLVQPVPPPPETGPLVTDRPDFTESPLAVPAGRVQLEVGYTFTDGQNGDRSHTLGEALIRIGLVERVELRIEAPSLEIALHRGGDDDAGLSDAGVGAKFELLDQATWAPQLGLIVGTSLPTGSDPFSADTVVPGATLAWSYELPSDLTLSGSFGAAAASDDDGRHFEGSASILLGAGLTEQLGSYIEYYALFPTGGRDDPHYINGGLTYLITDDLQIDFRIGAGLNEASDDFFAGLGFARRW